MGFIKSKFENFFADLKILNVNFDVKTKMISASIIPKHIPTTNAISISFEMKKLITNIIIIKRRKRNDIEKKLINNSNFV